MVVLVIMVVVMVVVRGRRSWSSVVVVVAVTVVVVRSSKLACIYIYIQLYTYGVVFNHKFLLEGGRFGVSGGRFDGFVGPLVAVKVWV